MEAMSFFFFFFFFFTVFSKQHQTEKMRARMLAANVPRMLRQQKGGQPLVQTVRYARRAPVRSPVKSTHEPVTTEKKTTTTTTTAPNKQYLEKFKAEMQSKGMQRVDVRKDLLLLDALNKSRPGTKTDMRYKRQQAKLEQLDNGDEKIQSLCHFLLNEIKIEIQQYPNPDDVGLADSDGEVVNPGQLEQMVEHELRRFFTSTVAQDGDSQRYKKFEVLLNILDSLRVKHGGVLILSADFYAETFQMAQFVEKEDLKNKLRYVCGSLIYSLKKFEMDYLSESQFIESLILHGDNKFAESLLIKRAEELDQRWWYELMIVNYLEMSEINKSEDIVKFIHERYGQYLDIRIYQLFINKYVESQNLEKLKEWLIKLTDSIITNGLIDEKHVSPGIDTTEEEALSYLNSEQPPTKDEYFEVLKLLLDVKEIPVEYPARMINFYISVQPEDIGSAVDLLLQYKHLYNFKVKPILNLIEEKHKGLNIGEYFEKYREVTPIETRNLDILEEIISIKTNSHQLKQRIFEIQTTLAQDGEVSSTQMFNLLSVLLKTKNVELANRLLTFMEVSKNKSGSLQNHEKLVIPEASPKHYLPFLRYHGRKGQLVELVEITERYQANHEFNPIILTQVLNSLSKMRRFDLCLLYIEEILINDIHLRDLEFNTSNTSFRELYSTIWKIIKDTLIELSNIKQHDGTASPQVDLLLSEKLPNLRYLFMKMIHEKVIPSSDDYYNIISSFFIVRDRLSVLCALQYLNNKHGLPLSEKTVRVVDKYCLFPNDVGYFKYVENKEQKERLNQLHFQTSNTTSFDPFFNPTTESIEVEEEPLLDLKTPEEDFQAQKQQNIKQLVWVNSFKKIHESLDTKTSTPHDLQTAHNDFELSYHQFEQLVNSWKET